MEVTTEWKREHFPCGHEQRTDAYGTACYCEEADEGRGEGWLFACPRYDPTAYDAWVGELVKKARETRISYAALVVLNFETVDGEWGCGCGWDERSECGGWEGDEKDADMQVIDALAAALAEDQ